ncbi:hypothetical protein G6553_20405 [Nocardioides sp. IC4_145]|uniref:hypothetical protein n=1 Tax=Nocardioides sp. IC4_145 TaxID=2714037 RepID=UPI0014084EE5|nr:hypothetical protein [Nocardioides sp. IC4_145]NHC25527.1 hypothetical protein [Nocardioides sp. IC4_145]
MTSLTTSPTTTVRPRLLVLPAVAVAAVAAVGLLSGLPLSGSSDAGAGVDLVAEDGRTATLTVTDLAPGDSATRTVTIANDAPEPARLTFTETGDPAAYAGGRLRLSVSSEGREVYDGTFGGLGDYPLDMGWLEAGASATYTFVVSLPHDAPVVPGGDTPATASYSWVTSD